MGRPRSTDIGLEDLRRRSKPGECPFCGDPIAPKVTKPHLSCGSPECETAYHRLYKRDKRRAKYALDNQN